MRPPVLTLSETMLDLMEKAASARHLAISIKRYSDPAASRLEQYALDLDAELLWWSRKY